jgi:hypothetical protein
MEMVRSCFHWLLMGVGVWMLQSVGIVVLVWGFWEGEGVRGGMMGCGEVRWGVWRRWFGLFWVGEGGVGERWFCADGGLMVER